MSRQQQQQQPQGVVLTGYHSNLEPLPKSGPRPPARPVDPEPEPNAPRWDLNNSNGGKRGKTERVKFCVESPCLFAMCERRDSAREQRSMSVLGFLSARRVFKRSVPHRRRGRRTWSGSFTPALHVGVERCFLLTTLRLSAYLHVNLDFASACHSHDSSEAPGITFCSIRM